MTAGADVVFEAFESDVLLPEQMFEVFRAGARLGREHLLMLAVLEDAVVCHRRYARARGGEGRRLFDEADTWLRSTDRTALFSFETICDVLGLDGPSLRGAVLGARRHSAHAPRRGGPRGIRPRVLAMRAAS